MNRRRFLQMVRPSAAPSVDRPAGAVVRAYHNPPSLERYSGPWDRAAVAHLLRRAVVAPTWAEMNEAAAMSMDDLVARLTAEDSSVPGAPPFVNQTVANESWVYWNDAMPWLADSFFSELRRWWLQLMVNGGLSVRERMTLFWHNHFAVQQPLVQDARWMYLQHQLFRRSAVGDFKKLVRDVTIDKAMLQFLNGRSNDFGARNENYARELQELFTIGIADNSGSANYTQQDVMEAARVLTGWDWDGAGFTGDVHCTVLSHHDTGDKVVYGTTITGRTEGGPELDQLLDVIFAKEETARYLVRKIYRFFLYTDVPLTPVSPIDPVVEEQIIAPLAAEFRASNWSIGAVLRRLFSSAHFYDPGFIGGSIKSPVDFFVSIIRSTLSGQFKGDAAEYATSYAQQWCTTLGQELFNPPGVQGWQFHHAWLGTTTLPQRRRASDELLEHASTIIVDRASLILTGPIERRGAWNVDVLAFAKQFPSFDDPTQLVHDIAEHLLAYKASPALLARLKEELVNGVDYEWSDAPAALQTTRLRAMLRYLMRSSNFQLL